MYVKYLFVLRLFPPETWDAIIKRGRRGHTYIHHLQIIEKYWTIIAYCSINVVYVFTLHQSTNTKYSSYAASEGVVLS